jgi:molecular chaperone HtpG
LQETLGDHVKEVRLSTRLTQSLACLITDTFGITPALVYVSGFRTGGSGGEASARHGPATGAQEPRHHDSSLAETAELLYGTALLAEGDVPEDPAKFAGLLADRLARTG